MGLHTEPESGNVTVAGFIYLPDQRVRRRILLVLVAKINVKVGGPDTENKSKLYCKPCPIPVTVILT